MVKQALVALVALAGLFPALASPAQDLFDEASFYVGFTYNGPTQNPGFRALRQQFQGQLDTACAGDANCPFAKAIPVVQAMIASFKDAFTVYVPAAVAADQERLVAGQGPAAPRIGVLVRPVDASRLVVVDAYAGEPGVEAGFARGDVIVTVNGGPATPQSLAAAEAAKTAISLAVSRAGTARTVSLTPRVAEEGNLPTYRNQGGVAVIRVPDLYASSEEGSGVGNRIHLLVRRAINDGARGVIVDLRDSNSGLDTEALYAAGAFLPRAGFIYKGRFLEDDSTYTFEGSVLYGQAEGGQRQPVGQIRAPQRTDLPTVVLVNRQTVNAAEMVAYLLQSAGRARVVGEATAGQLAVSGAADELINGDYVAVSSYRMHGLDDRPFPAAITPDVVVADDPAALANGTDLPLQRALELLGAR